MNLQNYINGAFTDAQSGKFIDNYNPAKGEVYSKVPRSGEEDVAAAANAAKQAFENWSNLSANKRAAYLMQIADKIDTRLNELALAEMHDTGKPLWLTTKVDIPRAATNFRFYASGIQHFSSESHFIENSALNYTLRQPVGVAGCISPWNLPLYLFSWKIAPALAAGCTVVAKPSEVTPVTAYLLAKIMDEVGLPKGVFNLINGLGSEAGAAIVQNKNVEAITFTGGTKTGKWIAKETAGAFKKTSLELGGKNPNIIFADADYQKALNNAIKAAYTNQGEICLCGSRILVQESIYEKFKKDFVAKAKQIKVGNPEEANSFMGALVSKHHIDKVASYVELAKQEGGKILCGGKRLKLPPPNNNGYFYSPTAIEGLPNNCRTNQEEIFGPVATLIPFSTEEQAIQIADDTQYGLAAQLWTNNLQRAHRITEKLHFGIIWVNCWMLRDLRTPFGGMKNSGTGREGGWDALRFFTEPKNVCISAR